MASLRKIKPMMMPTSIEVTPDTVWGRGYRMPESSKVKIKAFLEPKESVSEEARTG